MITINLLPVELRPIKRTPVPYMLSVILVVAAVATCVQMYATNVSAMSELEKDLANNEQELKSLEDSVEKYNQLSEEKKLLAAQLNTINEIASDRTIWSQELYRLTLLALPNMWYSGIQVVRKSIPVSTQVIDPKTKKTKTVKSKVTKRTLVLDGYVAADASGRISIHPFTSAAEEDEDFSKSFILDQWSVDDTEFDYTTVKAFTLEYTMVSGGSK